MANQYQFSGYQQFPYQGGSGDAPYMQGYAQQANDVGNISAGLFGGQSMSGFPPQYPVMNADDCSNFPCEYPQLRPFGSVGGMPQSLNNMQQFDQFIPGAFNPAAGNFYDAFPQEQEMSGFNSAGFMQRPSGNMGRGFGGFPGGKGFKNNQRGGNRFGNARKSNSLPSVTNPDGLREDTIFIKNLPKDIDHEVMKSNFGAIGKIKMNPKTGMPMIWIFKERGIPKGDAIVTYEDSSCVQAAIKHFSENDLMGKKITVKQAKNSQHPVIIPPGGGGGNYNNTNFGGGADPDDLAAPTGRGGFDANMNGMGRNFVRNPSQSRLPGANPTNGNRATGSALRLDDSNPNRMAGMGRGFPPRMGPGRGASIGGMNGNPAIVNNGGAMMGRGGIPPMRGRGARGGGPMRGRALAGGRMRPTPY